jgi:hypothetical protein
LNRTSEEEQYCPRQTTDPRYFHLLKLWRFYRNGILPVEGGFLKQPAYYMDAMNFIDVYVANNPETEE